MKKHLLKTLLTALVLLTGWGSSTWAQTDVTSTYLTNADFEGEYSVYSNPSSDRAIYQPEGWTISYSNGEKNDLTSLNSSCTQWNQFSNKAQPANGGNNTYWIRFRWGSTSRLTFSQDVTLPAGKYNLTADAFFNGNGGGSATISAAGQSLNVSGNSEWTNYGLEFTLANETTVTIAFGLNETSQAEVIAGFDNFKLTYTEVVVKDNLEKAIATATKVYDGTSDVTLNAAIADAQAVFDNVSATQQQVNDATATLNEAVATCLAAQSDYSFFITNPGFEQSDPFVGNKGTGSAENYEGTGWKALSTSTSNSCGAILGYGVSGNQINNVSVPATDLDGNTGNAMAISVGWSATVAYQSADAVILPAGEYVLLAYVYNANTQGQNFTSKFGFVPTVGNPILSSTTSFASGKWTLDYVQFTLTEATEGKFQIGGTAGNNTSTTHAKVFIDNLTLTNAEGLASAQSKIAKPNWLAAKAAAQAALVDPAYANVIGTEKTALEAEIAKDEPTTVDGYEEAVENLNTATATFTSAKSAYDLYAEYKDVELPYAAETAKPEINEYTTAEVIVSLLRAYYESNAMAEGVAGAENKTSLIKNPAAEDGTNSWTMTPSGGINVKSNEPWTDEDNSAPKYFDSNKWGDSSWNITLTQDVTLPQGNYLLTVKSRGADGVDMKLMAGDEEQPLGVIGASGGVFNRGWNDTSIEFEVVEEGPVTIGVNGVASAIHLWMSFSDFRLVRLGDSEDGLVLAEANELAADDDAVAVGKLRDAIATYNEGGEIAGLAAAVEQFKTDNADQGKDETSKVGTDKEKWTVGTGNNSNRGTYTKNGITLVEHYGESDAGVMISQQVNVDNGLYNIELYATSHNAWNNNGANLQTDADDVAYVFGTSGSNTIKTWITARRNSGMLDSEPEVYAVNGLEVNDGKITMGLALERAGQTEWHTIQIKKLTLVTTAKNVYALDKTEMTDLISEAEALAANEYKTEGKAALNTAIMAAQAALESNKLNISEFEAEIRALKDAIEAFTTANYVAMTGTYYVQNATSGKYMAAGHSWGTQAIVNESGLDMTLSAGTDKKVTFDSQVFNGDNNHFLGSNLYMDSPAYAWIIEQTGENEYTIGNGAKYLGVDASDNLVLVDEAVTWKFLAAANVQSQRQTDGLTALEAATADNGVDATFLLKDADFNRNDHRWAAWTVSTNCTNRNLGGGGTATNGNGCAESFHSLFTISQTVNNAPAGVYKMTAQGFFRQDDGETEDIPLFFAGDKTADVPAKTGSEGSMGDASISFSNGLYAIEPIEFIVGEDGVLTVGIKNETAVHQWVIFDNFQLTYYGPAPKTTVTLAVTDAQYATFVAPFDVEIPGGVTAYVVEGVDSETNEIVMDELSTIPANKPVVLFSESAYSTEVEGVAVPAEDLTYGILTGTYEDIDAIEGTYILQKQSSVAFFKVETTGITKVKANHAYLTAPASGARAYYFGGAATAIGALKALTGGDAEIYDVNGRKQVKLQKGVNIIRTKDGRTQKVMVK